MIRCRGPHVRETAVLALAAAATLAAALAHTSVAADNPTESALPAGSGDFAVGSGRAEGPFQFGNVRFSAHAGPNGENPAGIVNLFWENYRGGPTPSP